VATTMIKSQQARKAAANDEGPIAEPPSEIAKEERDSLDELMSQAQGAYESYLQAQKKVALAYQERQHRVEESFKEIEEHAAKLCAVAIDEAVRSLEKAEQEAEGTYKKAKLSAMQAYQDSLDEALRIRGDTVELAWEEAKRNSERIWKVFQGEVKR
jgi:molecular chaperone GrpE (heat shock protein)